MYARQYKVALNADTEICILIGAMLGLQEISLCLLDEGDFYLMPAPCYPDYWSGVALAGAVTHSMPLTAENRFLPDLKAVPKEVASAAKLMFLNFPTNPTGAVASPDFFADVVDFARTNQIAVANDLAYGDLIYDGRQPISFLQTPGTNHRCHEPATGPPELQPVGRRASGRHRCAGWPVCSCGSATWWWRPVWVSAPQARATCGAPSQPPQNGW